jgi:hypothetical protein
MDIGLNHALATLNNDSKLGAITNQKIEEYKKAEAQLRELERELANAKE